MNLNRPYGNRSIVNGVGDPITLIGGETVDTDNIRFNPSIHHFYYGETDITNRIFRRDKEQYWSAFDSTIDNERLYVEKYVRENGELPPAVGPTDVWAIFFEQLATDPLDAPLEAIDVAIGKIGDSTFGKVAVTLVALYAAITVAKVFAK